MKLIVIFTAVLLVSSLAWAASKTYQATGPVAACEAALRGDAAPSLLPESDQTPQAAA